MLQKSDFAISAKTSLHVKMTTTPPVTVSIFLEPELLMAQSFRYSKITRNILVKYIRKPLTVKSSTDLHRVHANLSIVLLCLQLQLNVEQCDLWVHIALGLHLKASIGEGLLECNTSDKLRFLIDSRNKNGVNLRSF